MSRTRYLSFAIAFAFSLVILKTVFVSVGALVLAPGDLDATFGTGGRVVTSFPGGLDTANDTAVQADGRIVVAGTSGTDFALTRYNTDGSLDASFGVGGRVHTDFPTGLGGVAYALVIQPDGKLVLAGSASESATSFNSVFALVRYNTDGSLDTSFDGDGRVVTTFAGSSATARALALQPDGKLVAAGLASDSTTFNSVYALARYNTDGSLDTSFDTDGRVTTDFPGLTFEEIHAVAIQTNGRIVVGGLGNAAFSLARYTTTGALDTSFDTDGFVTTAFGGTFEEANALAIQSDGKIVAAGQTAISTAANMNFALARYNTDGSLDTSFDTDGKVTTDFGLVDAASDVVIQTDGRVIAAGRAGTTAGGSFFALARYDTNGGLDTSFDTDGKVTTDFSGGRFGLGALGVALQTDGRIVAAGDANLTGQRDFGVARYNTNGSLDTSFDTDGKLITDFTLNDDGITALLVQADGRIVAAGRNELRIRIGQAQDPNFELARYNTDGTLDMTFGSGGLVSTDFANNGDDFGNAAALQGDGKIIVVGQTGAHFSQLPSADTSFAVARYNTDGTLDASFGSGGRVTTNFGTTHDRALAVAVQPDGRIVVAGTNGTDFILARYNTNGSLDDGTGTDTTPGDFFGTSGRVTTDFSGGLDSASALVIQPDGKVVA
ncbi:MAG TPA: delta-60 repeat domain-containing protein, partial [Pyrinomonadaceae bacterium]